MAKKLIEALVAKEIQTRFKDLRNFTNATTLLREALPLPSAEEMHKHADEWQKRFEVKCQAIDQYLYALIQQLNTE